MGVIAQWGDINFEITTDSALLIHDLKLTAESETEDKDKKKQSYVSYKKGKPAEINFDVDVLSVFGQDVRQIVTKLLHAAQRGSKEFFYVGEEKIFPAKTIMTKAEAKEIEIAPNGKWVRAIVAIKLEQASAEYIIPDPEKEKTTSGGGGGGSGSGKASVKTQDAVITYNVNGYTEYYYTPSANAAKAQAAANAATAKAAATITTAKTTTSSVTKTTTTTTSSKITAGLPRR